VDEQTREFYNAHAHDLARRYESVDGGVGRLFPLLFRAGDEVLDLGAGTGRDCARLLAMGIHAWGIEPSQELRGLALRLHPELDGRILPGMLPDELGAVRGRRFDAAIMSAVIMHIPDPRLFDTAVAVRALLKPGGHLVVSASTARTDVDPQTSRDAGGRLFVIRAAAEIHSLFARAGFTLIRDETDADALGRPGIEWVTLVLRASPP
jgi:SAM-dependent methyltransferase